MVELAVCSGRRSVCRPAGTGLRQFCDSLETACRLKLPGLDHPGPNVPGSGRISTGEPPSRGPTN